MFSRARWSELYHTQALGLLWNILAIFLAGAGLLSLFLGRGTGMILGLMGASVVALYLSLKTWVVDAPRDRRGDDGWGGGRGDDDEPRDDGPEPNGGLSLNWDDFDQWRAAGEPQPLETGR